MIVSTVSEVSASQLDIALRLAYSCYHEWAQVLGVAGEDGRVRLRDDIADELFGTGRLLRPQQSRVEAVIAETTTRDSPWDRSGIRAPAFEGRSIVHETGSGRLRWEVSPDGSLDLHVQRDASVAGGLAGTPLTVLSAHCGMSVDRDSGVRTPYVTVEAGRHCLERHWDTLGDALHYAGFPPAMAVAEVRPQYFMEPDGWENFAHRWPGLVADFRLPPEHASSKEFERLVVAAVTSTPLSSRDILALRNYLEAAAGTGLARPVAVDDGSLLQEASHPTFGTLRWDTGTDSKNRPFVTLEVAGMGRYYAAGLGGLASEISEHEARGRRWYPMRLYEPELFHECELYEHSSGPLSVVLHTAGGSWALALYDLGMNTPPRKLFEVDGGRDFYLYPRDEPRKKLLPVAERSIDPAMRDLLTIVRSRVPQLPADSMLARMTVGDLSPSAAARTSGRGQPTTEMAR